MAMKLTLKDHAFKICDDGSIRTLDKFEIGRYAVKRVNVFEKNRHQYMNISIYGSGEYLPEIYYDDGFWSDGAPKFTIQTTAYGAMGAEEIEKVVEGYQEAIEVVKVLEANFI